MLAANDVALKGWAITDGGANQGCVSWVEVQVRLSRARRIPVLGDAWVGRRTQAVRRVRAWPGA